jgi:hypothetical protein
MVTRQPPDGQENSPSTLKSCSRNTAKLPAKRPGSSSLHIAGIKKNPPLGPEGHGEAGRGWEMHGGARRCVAGLSRARIVNFELFRGSARIGGAGRRADGRGIAGLGKARQPLIFMRTK